MVRKSPRSNSKKSSPKRTSDSTRRAKEISVPSIGLPSKDHSLHERYREVMAQAKTAWSRSLILHALSLYYESDQWQAIRKQAFLRDGFQCTRCHQQGHKPKNSLQCHHHTYPEDLFKDDCVDNVVTVCMDCHKKVEEEKKALKERS